MALAPVAQVEGATLSVDLDATGVVTAVQVDVPGPRSAVVQVTNPAGRSVRDQIVLPPSATPYRYNIPPNRRAVWDDGMAVSASGWTFTFGSA